LTLLVSAAIAACSGGPVATQGPAATTPGGGGGSTPAPQATQPGGGGGGGGPDFANGKGHFEVSGPATKSGDLGFLPIASHFGGMDQTILNFTAGDTDKTETLTITVASGGQLTAIYASLDLTVTGIECTASNLNIGATSASGSFDCSKTMAVMSSGSVEGAVLKGNFEARA
jgi:hypothetical protein